MPIMKTVFIDYDGSEVRIVYDGRVRGSVTKARDVGFFKYLGASAAKKGDVGLLIKAGSDNEDPCEYDLDKALREGLIGEYRVSGGIVIPLKGAGDMQ